MSKLSHANLYRRVALLTSAAALAVSGQAVAQTSPAGADQADEAPTVSGDIIVTARRREESLQKVPVTVSALTADTLTSAGVYDAHSLYREVPGLQNFNRLPGNANVQNLLRIRGVAGVGLYFAEAPSVYVQSSFYAPFFDIENVQILKGPQGTLFGQASNAGAQIITPRGPGEEFGGYLTAEVGSYERKSIEGAVDVPVVDDKILLRVAAKTSFREGHIKDVYSDWRLGREDYDLVRATLVVRPTESIENSTLFQYQAVRDIGNVTYLGDFNFSPQFNVAAQAAINGMTTAQYNAARDLILSRQIALGPYRFQGWSNGCAASQFSPATKSTVPGPNIDAIVSQSCRPFTTSRRDYLVVNRTTFDITDNISLKNIFSYSWGYIKQSETDSDSTRLILFEANPRNAGNKREPDTWSNEVQVSGRFFDDKLKMVGGYFRFHQFTRPLLSSPAFSSFITSLADVATLQKSTTSNWSIYGQADLDMSDWIPGLSLTAGVRSSHDKATNRVDVLNPVTFAVTSTTAGPGTPNGEGKWSAVSYTLGAQYQITDDTMIYVTNAKGYSSGGLQNTAGFERFDPDTLNNVEAGVKTTIRTGNLTLRANAAAYMGWFNNVKVAQVLLVSTPGGGQAFVSSTQNAAKAKISGFEAEINGSVGRTLDFRLWVGNSNAHYTKYETTFSPTGLPADARVVDISDTPWAINPKWKFGGSLTYHIPVDEAAIGRVSLTANYSYAGQYWASVSKPLTPLNPANPNTGAVCKVQRTAANGYGPLSADGKTAWRNCMPALDNLNLSVNWSEFMGMEALSLRVAMNNVLGNKNPMGQSGFYDGSGFESYVSNLPRMWTASLSYKF